MGHEWEENAIYTCGHCRTPKDGMKPLRDCSTFLLRLDTVALNEWHGKLGKTTHTVTPVLFLKL